MAQRVWLAVHSMGWMVSYPFWPDARTSSAVSVSWGGTPGSDEGARVSCWLTSREPRERRPRRSWPIRATPTIRTKAAPASAATSKATATGTCPDAEKNSMRTERVFWARKSTNAMPSATPTNRVAQAQLILVRRAPEWLGRRPFRSVGDSVGDVMLSTYPVHQLSNSQDTQAHGLADDSDTRALGKAVEEVCERRTDMVRNSKSPPRDAEGRFVKPSGYRLVCYSRP
jgi:hypothetical protein